jgi:hypothetical protein
MNSSSAQYVIDGLGYLPCDDGSKIQSTHCDGIGKVSVEKAETTAGKAGANARW